MNKNKDLRKILMKIIFKQYLGHYYYWEKEKLKKEISDDFPFIKEEHISVSSLITLVARFSLALPFVLLFFIGNVQTLVFALIFGISVPLNFFIFSVIPSYIYLYRKYKDTDLDGFSWKTYEENKFDPYDKHW